MSVPATLSLPWLRPIVSGLLCAGLLILVPGAGGQEAGGFSEERRITAIDLVVAFETGATRHWATERNVPKGLSPQALEVVVGGSPRPVIAVESAAEPWHIVLYFDTVLSSTGDLKWAASTLAQKSAEMVAMGTVTVVVADPAPRTLLAPTRDNDRLHAILSQIAQTQEGQDEILTLRGEVIAALESPEQQVDVELLETVVDGEARRIRERQDGLLLTLLDTEAAGPRRALMLVGGGFDLRPMDFYQPLIERARRPEDGSSASASTSTSDLTASTETLARTLAAYGWVTVHLAPPEREVLKPGVRIGKFRLSGPGITYDEVNNRTLFKLFGASYEEHRKPERAEAFLELGSALEGQGKLERAEESLRQAIYYFGGDPRTAVRQAEAFAHLGRVLEAQGKSLQATEALEVARQLDPGSAPEEQAIARLLDEEQALELLVRATAGSTVRNAGGLEGILTDLRNRVRLTYQVAGPPDGQLHALQVRFEDASWRLEHPVWARSSIPEPVAAARARRLLAGELTGGDLPLAANFHPSRDSELGEGTVVLRPSSAFSEPPPSEAPPPVLRLTLGSAGPDTEPTIEHRYLGPQELTEAWVYTAEVELLDDRPWLAVLVGDLETGAWAGRLIERY